MIDLQPHSWSCLATLTSYGSFTLGLQPAAVVVVAVVATTAAAAAVAAVVAAATAAAAVAAVAVATTAAAAAWGGDQSKVGGVGRQESSQLGDIAGAYAIEGFRSSLAQHCGKHDAVA